MHTVAPVHEAPKPPCLDLVAAGYDYERAADETWEALLSADAFTEGNFTLASGEDATLKVDAEKLYEHPRQLDVVIGHFATFPCVQSADVLLYVPNGMHDFVQRVGRELNKSVAYTRRRPNSTSRYDFEFSSAFDKELATAAEKLVIGEDVVSTLGSVAAIRSLLLPTAAVHSLAILRRGEVAPEYRKGLIDHYLVSKLIPKDKDEFNRQRAAGLL